MNRIRSALTAVKLIRDTVQADGQVVITAEGGFIAENCDKTIIKALEKQIPQKPIYVDTRFRNHGRSIADGLSLSKCYKCPTCWSHIFHVWDSEKNCVYCGQALDWDESIVCEQKEDDSDELEV